MNKNNSSGNLLIEKIPINHFLLIMRTTIFLLFTCVFCSMAELSYTQNARVTINKRNATIKEILNEIEKQTDYLFIYNNEVNTNEKVSVKAKQEAVSSILNSMLKDKDMNYSMEGNHIILSTNTNESPESKIEPNAQQQKKRISGTVFDEKGQPIIGANIIEAGTTNGTVTDIDGKFTIDVTDNATIRISYIGYLEQEVSTAGKNTLNITLVEDTKTLEEVVVVGYGTMKKSDLTGSISSIKSEDIQKSPVTSLDQALQGKAAGVQVTQASSAPGGRVIIRIRGGNSLSSSNEPLYVIDGFPISAGGSAGGTGIAQNPLATLNTSDIESMEILKDASATAIYGSRGANGVVLITTKKGRTGKPKVTFDAYYGIQSLSKKLDMMNAVEYATLVNEARINDGQSPVFPNLNNLYYFPEISSLGQGVDYQNEVFVDAPISNYNIGINGGTEVISYAIGGGYFGQNGIIKNSDFNRASFRSNLEIKLLQNLKISTNTSASHSWANGTTSEGDGGSSGDIVWATIMMPPTVPIYDQNGNYTMVNPTPGGTPANNPVAIANHYSDKQEIDRFLGSIDINWEVIRDLMFKITFGTDMSSSNRAYYWPKETYQGFSRNGDAGQSNVKHSSYLNENTLSYNKIFGNHSFNGVLGYTWQVFHSKNFNAGSSNYSTDLYKADNLSAGTTYSTPGSYQDQSQLASYLGRLNYIYKGRYLITLTGRADGSSRFGTNNKWAFFPSMAFAWRLSEEDFIKELKWLSNVKFRASYGKTGNQNIANYQSLARLGIMNYPIGNELSAGLGPLNIPNPDLKWETTATTNVGIDLGFFNNRLNLVADYYYKKTSDLLWNISIPSSSGFTSIFKNIGSIENKGLELALNADIFTKQFKWDSNLNWSLNRNKVLEIPGYTPSNQGTISGHLKINGSWLEPGLPVGVWNLLKFDGVFQDQSQLEAGPRSSQKDKLGDARFIDRNGDGKIILSDDRMIVGDPNPDFIYGWTNNFSFKRFDLSIYLQGSYGNDILNVQRAETNVSGPWGNQRREILDRWSPSNTQTNIPRARVTVDPLLVQSDWLIEDGSYLRFKTISLGYTFKNVRFLNSLRIYVTGQNLITLTNYSGFDPEVNSPGNTNLQLGVDYNAYPAAKSLMLGLNASF